MSVWARGEPLTIERRFYLYRSQVEERQWVCWCRNWFWIGTDQYQAVPAPRAMVTPPLSIIIVNQPLTSRKLRISPRMQSKNICLSLFTHWAAPGPGWAKLPLAILQNKNKWPHWIVIQSLKAVIEEGWIVFVIITSEKVELVGRSSIFLCLCGC